MKHEFYSKIKENSPLESMHQALQCIPQKSDQSYITIQQIDTILELIVIYESDDKLNIDQIEKFKELLDQLNQDTEIYRSSLKQYEQYVRNIEYHASEQIKKLNISLDLPQLRWIKKAIKLSADIEIVLKAKIQDLILQSFKSQDRIKDEKFVIQYDDTRIDVKIDFTVESLSDMIKLLYGYLEYVEVLQIPLEEFIINNLANTVKLMAMKQIIQIDDIPPHDKYYQQALQCTELADLPNNQLKISSYKKMEELQANLVYFKNKFFEAVDKLDFKQNWKNYLFKVKATQQVHIFQDLTKEIKILNAYLCDDENILKIIVDHYKLLDILLQNKQITHCFQSLNIYIALYSQMEFELKKILKHCELGEFVDFLLQIKLQITYYQSQLDEVSEQQ